MPFDARTITPAIKQAALAWKDDPAAEPTTELAAWLVRTFDVEDSFVVRCGLLLNNRRIFAGKCPELPLPRFTYEGASLFVCCLLWDIDDEGRAPSADEMALAQRLVESVWTPKAADEVINVDGADERWESRLR